VKDCELLSGPLGRVTSYSHFYSVSVVFIVGPDECIFDEIIEPEASVVNVQH
jgi:hypothetical protein